MSFTSFSKGYLRACTSSFSSRSLPWSSLHRRAGRKAQVGHRYYTEQPSNDMAETKPLEEAEVKVEGTSVGLDALEAKQAEVVDLTGRLRYLQADFLNLQRNAAREKDQTRDFAISRFAGDLLETVDVLAMALKSIPPTALRSTPLNETSIETKELKSAPEYLQELHTGVEMTHRLLLQTLFKYRIKPFDPTGDRFDPNLHEALYQAPVPNKDPGTVIECQKIGYKIGERVLRAAQVGVVQDIS